MSGAIREGLRSLKAYPLEPGACYERNTKLWEQWGEGRVTPAHQPFTAVATQRATTNTELHCKLAGTELSFSLCGTNHSYPRWKLLVHSEESALICISDTELIDCDAQITDYSQPPKQCKVFKHVLDYCCSFMTKKWRNVQLSLSESGYTRIDDNCGINKNEILI